MTDAERLAQLRRATESILHMDGRDPLLNERLGQQVKGEMPWLLDLAEEGLRARAIPGFHVLEVREASWGLEHPLACRDDQGYLVDCPVHLAALELTAPPAEPGRYQVEVGSSGDLVLSELARRGAE